MILKNPALIAQLLARFNISYESPEEMAMYRHRLRRYYDTQLIALADGGVPIKFFGESTSYAAGQATYKLAGCNLPTPGRLPGNTSMIVSNIELELLKNTGGTLTAAFLADCEIVSRFGIAQGVFVNKTPQLDEFLVGPCIVDRGLNIETPGAGSTAQVLNGVRGTEPAGMVLTPESYVVIPEDQEFYVPVYQQSGGALSATCLARLSFYGLEIQRR